ncbi:MAG: hypothetical protein EP347_00950 [Alphaproteobacteria bacterium]|nr:MAG: hypothetical protein EP347_00950 [Alphaproteobacteria bacterium]
MLEWFRTNITNILLVVVVVLITVLVLLLAAYVVNPDLLHVTLFTVYVELSDQQLEKYGEYQDAIHMAAQMGRLDVLSLILGLFGLFMAMVAVMGFWLIRQAAVNRAAIEAQNTVNHLNNIGKLNNGTTSHAVLVNSELEASPEIMPSVDNKQREDEQ